ncbi:MAG TPA: acyltransferase family protein [Acidimicrobiales bacterium]|nr:acyltransferase family protein [Acidimicrobiales bacterium]
MGSTPAGKSDSGYMPALDGLRAVAVILVLFYHGGFGWAQGGFLGVEVFFVLSGYLITTLLLREWSKNGRVSLGAFWVRRARRILPALFLVLAGVVVYAAVFAPTGSGETLRSDGLATLFFWANWHQAYFDQGYFVVTAVPSPLLHTWSLGIEEQFYVVWPLVVVAVLRFSRSTKVLFAVAGAGAVTSAVLMAVLYRGGAGVSRVYYGTDTRAQGLMAGAALAVALASWGRDRTDGPAHARNDAPTSRSLGGVAAGLAGLTGAAVVLLVSWRATGASSALYRFGFLGVDLAVLAVIYSATKVPTSPLARLLSLRPLRAVGTISYGLYLWHWPVFVVLDGARTGEKGWALFGIRVAATFVVSVASYVLVERPVRFGALRSLHPAFALPAAVVAIGGSLALATSVGAVALPVLSSGPGGNSQGPPVTTLVKGPPPQGTVRALLVGDSMAVTLGFGLETGESNYRVSMDDVAILGCGFDPVSEISFAGSTTKENSACATDLRTWAAEAVSFHASVVVVEMGYWDCADHLIGGKWVHVGDPGFDATLSDWIARTITALGAGGRPVVFMTVPGTNAGEQLDGSAWPYDQPSRHAAMNALIRNVVSRFPGRAYVVDINPVVSPEGVYGQYATLTFRDPSLVPQAPLGTQILARSDGVHFTAAGGEMLEPALFPLVHRVGEAYVSGKR